MNSFSRFLFLTLLLGTLLVQNTGSKKILALEFFGSKSHVITYLSMLEELSRRGHEVTVVGPGKGLTKEKKIREIFTVSADIFFDGTHKDLYTMKETGDTENPFTLLTAILPKHCRDLYDRPDLKAIMNEEFDLVLVQPLFNDCSLGFVHKLISKKKSSSSSNTTTSLVLFSPTSAPNFLVEYTGGYHPPSFVSNTFTGFGDDMTFLERFVNFGVNVIFETIISLYYIPAMEEIYREKVGQDTPSVGNILGQASLILSNGHFSTSRPKPNLPDVVDIGGIHSRKAEPLPKDLEEFISRGGENGFILFSLGSGLRGDKMSEAKRSIFLNVFSRLKQQVVWKYESDIPNLPSNVYISKWLPQQDLLGHPKIKFFITHCGGGGTEEAIYHGTPLLGMPFFGDQPLNAQGAEKHGYLVQLEWNELSEEVLMAKINELLNNPKYRENVERLSRVFRDQLGSPLDRGVYWMEYVMRHNGAPHLRSPARDLNRFQYHSLDVIAAYLAIIATILFLLIKLVKFVLSICLGSSKTSKKQKRS